jgi:hypothetical protein
VGSALKQGNLTPCLSSEFTSSAYWAIQGGFRAARSMKSGTVGSEHLLLSLAQRDRQVRLLVGSKFRRLRRCVAQGRWEMSGQYPTLHRNVPEGVLAEAAATLREAQWQALGFDRLDPNRPRWTSELEDVLVEALQRVVGNEAPLATSTDLLFAVLKSPTKVASGVLQEVGVSKSALLDISRERRVGGDDEVIRTPIADTLSQYGIVSASGTSMPVTMLARIMRGIAMRAAEASPVLVELEFEAVRGAVRHGHRQVGTVHLMSAIANLNQQISAAGMTFVDACSRDGEGAQILLENGLTGAVILKYLSDFRDVGRPAPPSRHRELRTKPMNPEWTYGAAEAADLSRLLAKQGNEAAGTLHLLIALLRDSSNLATTMVRTLGRDPATMLAYAESRL